MPKLNCFLILMASSQTAWHVSVPSDSTGVQRWRVSQMKSILKVMVKQCHTWRLKSGDLIFFNFEILLICCIVNCQLVRILSLCHPWNLYSRTTEGCTLVWCIVSHLKQRSDQFNAIFVSVTESRFGGSLSSTSCLEVWKHFSWGQEDLESNFQSREEIFRLTWHSLVTYDTIPSFTSSSLIGLFQINTSLFMSTGSQF